MTFNILSQAVNEMEQIFLFALYYPPPQKVAVTETDFL